MAKTGNPPPSQEAPSYKRQSYIQPGANMVDFSSAYSGFVRSGKTISSLGSSITKNASSQMAVEKAVQDAQTPGRKLLPALNSATANYNKAYRDEEQQVIQFQADKYLGNIYKELRNKTNLNSQDLLKFEQNAKEGLSQLSNSNLSPESKRNLELSYERYFDSLSQKVERNNIKYLEQQNAAQYQHNHNEMMNAARSDHKELSQQYYNMALKDLYQKAALNNTPLEVVAEQEKQLKLDYKTGELQNKYLETPVKDRPKFISELREKLPDDLEPLEKDQLIQNIQQFSNQYESAYKGQQYINYNEAAAKIEDGTLTQQDLLELEDKVDPYQLSDLQLKQTKKNAKEARLINQAKLIVEKSDKPIFLANQDQNQIDYAADEVILKQAAIQKGEELDLLEQSQALNNFKAPVKSFQDRLSAAIQDGSPEEALSSALAIKNAQINNMALLKGMDKKDIAVANLYENISRNPEYQGIEGIKKVRDSVYNMSDAIREENERKVATWKRDRGLNDSNNLKSHVYNKLDFGFFSSKRAVPAGLEQMYLNNVSAEIMISGNSKIAENTVAAQMKEIYSETNTNNRKEIMWGTPEKFYPNMGYVLENDKIKSLKNVIENNNKRKEEGGYTFNELNWESAPNTEDLLSKPLHNGDIKIKVNGKERKIIIQSDAITQFSPTPNPSWSFNYLDDNGVPAPLIDPETGVAYRWEPDTEFFESIPDKYPDVQLKIAEQVRKQYLENQEIRRKEIYLGD